MMITEENMDKETLKEAEEEKNSASEGAVTDSDEEVTEEAVEKAED